MIKVRSAYRQLYTHKQPWSVKVSVHLEGSGTWGELVEYLTTEHPDADLNSIHIAPAFLSYRVEPTQEDLDQHAAWVAEHEAKSKDRREAWERKTYAELKAKFEPEDGTR